ncbi:MAG: hypothetical protein KIC89_17895 [Acetobacteraceae bacterium]|nr:hypothetical protein [Acetobacteraceae bacterium]
MTDTITHATAEIALSKLDPSPANVRRTGTGLGVEALTLDAVREGAGGDVAHRLRDARKEAMVRDAAALLDGKRWLPRALRVPEGPTKGDGMPGDAPALAANDGAADLPAAAE